MDARFFLLLSADGILVISPSPSLLLYRQMSLSSDVLFLLISPSADATFSTRGTDSHSESSVEETHPPDSS